MLKSKKFLFSLFVFGLILVGLSHFINNGGNASSSNYNGFLRTIKGFESACGLSTSNKFIDEALFELAIEYQKSFKESRHAMILGAQKIEAILDSKFCKSTHLIGQRVKIRGQKVSCDKLIGPTDLASYSCVIVEKATQMAVVP